MIVKKLIKYHFKKSTPHYMSHNSLENNNLKLIERKELYSLKRKYFSSILVFSDILE